jgi:phosphoadenosine phosphosulfate reductase
MQIKINDIQQQLADKGIAMQLQLLAAWFPGKVVFSTSLGQEDQVITDIIAKQNVDVKIFTLDTGRLFNETYELADKTRARYKRAIEVYFPAYDNVQNLVTKKGFTSFYESVENRKECCYIRKIEPLNRALQGAKVWITGLRKEQSDNRQQMELIEWDEQKQLYKFNPLINWSYEEVLQYINENNVPYNVLHDKGFISIGCLPCTRAIEPGEDARAGRWWWEASKKECGLHE